MMRRNITLPTKVTVVAAAAALALAACGGSGSDSSGGGDKSVKIGIAAPLTGEVAFYAPIGTGLKAYLEYVNDKGGVNGYTFDTTVLDNKVTAEGGVSTARKLLRENVFALMMTGSASFQASAPIIKKSDPDLPVFASADAALIKGSGLSHAYGVLPSYATECETHADFAKNTLKAASVAIVYQDDAVGQSVADSCPDYAKSLGLKVTTIAVPAKSTNFGPTAAKIRQSGADVTMAYTFSQLLAGTQKAAKAVGYDGDWITFSTNDEAYIDIAGAESEGLYVTQWREPVESDTAEAKLFRKEIADRLDAKSVNGNAVIGWTFGALVERAVKDATTGGKKLTQAAFVDALDAIDGEQIGMAYKLSYGDKGEPSSEVQVLQVSDGKLSEVK